VIFNNDASSQFFSYYHFYSVRDSLPRDLQKSLSFHMTVEIKDNGCF